MATYYMRADGSAANKAAATSAGAASTSMDIAKHNSETFSAGDIIVVSDAGGIYRAILTPPSSGSSGSPIVYIPSGAPVINGSDVTTSWTSESASTEDFTDGSGDKPEGYWLMAEASGSR